MKEHEPRMNKSVWWAVARSEEVNSDKPINVNIGDDPIVLWRDHQGTARALEDRCPHRRAPLSLGCVLGNGMIQCGYHGWTYDGETGHLKDIPNLKSDAKFPKLYRAQAYQVVESGGFVRLCADTKATPIDAPSQSLPLSGSVDVALSHDQYLAALFDDPSLVISIRGVLFTPYLMSELAEVDGQLVLERSCKWAGPHWPSPFTSDFPITLRISTDPVTGESELLLRDDAFKPLLRARVAPVPAARGVTQVRWRAKLESQRSGLRAKLMGLGQPFSVLSSVDGAALRVLRPSASIHAAALRETMTNTQPAEAGVA